MVDFLSLPPEHERDPIQRMNTIGIIGTAGRKDDAARLGRRAYEQMYHAVETAIDEWGCTAAVSGGAAWADHLAVRAFLAEKVASLTVHLPAPIVGARYADQGDGRIANYYQQQFGRACHIDPFAEITEAGRRGATLVVSSRGFKTRNLMIGKDATHLIAFTFGSARALTADFVKGDHGFVLMASAGGKIGGTAHCWEHAANPAVKRHVDLFRLLRPKANLNAQVKKKAATAQMGAFGA